MVVHLMQVSDFGKIFIEQRNNVQLELYAKNISEKSLWK